MLSESGKLCPETPYLKLTLVEWRQLHLWQSDPDPLLQRGVSLFLTKFKGQSV